MTQVQGRSGGGGFWGYSPECFFKSPESFGLIVFSKILFFNTYYTEIFKTVQYRFPAGSIKRYQLLLFLSLSSPTASSRHTHIATPPVNHSARYSSHLIHLKHFYVVITGVVPKSDSLPEFDSPRVNAHDVILCRQLRKQTDIRRRK